MEENIKNLKKTNLNKTWLLVAGLVALTVVLLVVSLTSKNLPLLPSSPKEAKIVNAHTSLSISEEPKISTTSGIYEVEVNIDTSDNQVSGIQLELSYDPKVLTKVSVKPGTFLTNPDVFLNKIDAANGRITYALGNRLEDKPVKGKGVVAVISFSKVGNGETAISFLPHTQVSSRGQSVLKETSSAIIGELPSSTSAQTSQ